MATGNSGVKDFPNVVTQALVTANRKVTHVTLWQENTITNYIATIDNTDSGVVKLGQIIRMPANFATFTIPTPAGGSALAATRAVRGLIGDGLYAIAHFGPPGATFKGNRLTELGIAFLPIAEWSISG